jgi:hypothetical protein
MITLEDKGIVGRRAIDLLALPLDPVEFLVKHLRAVPESLPSCGALPVVLGVVPSGGDAVLSFILR